MNAIVYVLRSGCAWRLLPHEFSTWQTVYRYFRGVGHERGMGSDPHSPAGETTAKGGTQANAQRGYFLDSQSVKITRQGGFPVVTTEPKKVNGRKRHAFGRHGRDC